MQWNDYYSDKPKLRPRPVPLPPPPAPFFPKLLVALLCCSQAITGWLLYSAHPAPAQASVSSRPADIEQRFTDISVVLRFLLDKAKQPGVNTAAANITSSEEDLGRDAMIVTVKTPSAYLRTGPSLEHSPLMTISQGTRLVVETRQGDWYRVIAPNGQRTWINKEVLTRS